MLLNPVAARCRMNRVVIELDTGADSQIGIFFAQPIDFIEIDSLVVPVVIGKSNVR